MLHKRSNNVDKSIIKVGKNTFKQVLIYAEDAPNFAMRKFTIDVDGFMPMHTNSVEHEQYILRGKAQIIIGQKSIIVNKDDIVYIPKEEPHSYKNIGDEPFEFLCVVPNKEDEIKILD